MYMYLLSQFLHVAAAIVWLGGMFFLLWALRPVAVASLEPPVRVPLMAAVLRRFFMAVWVSIAVLLATGLAMLMAVGMKNAPIGQHIMLTIGLVMFALFGHIYFGPFRRLNQAAAAQNWPAAGKQMGKMHPLVVVNFVLGWLAIAAVYFVR